MARAYRTPPVALGGKIHDTAKLLGGFRPTRRLVFRLYGPGDPTCAKPPRFTTAQAVSGNGSYQSANFTPTAPGTYRWRATYTGDSANTARNGACNAPGESVTVTRAG